MLNALLAIITAIPALQKLFESLMVLFSQKQLESMRVENRDALKKALSLHDQREIEKLVTTNPGAHSQVPGTEIRDSLPGVEK